MEQNKWRFPASHHGERKGISSGDTEAFKKSPHQAFAREILQNSIDARDSDEEPTVVEFEIFNLKTEDIPGYHELKNAIRRCSEFWSHKADYVAEYEAMKKVLEKDTISCLRVSDFNTTGLIGVETTEQENNKFLALAKGTGVSEKPGQVAGGSKGVGKNAAFLMSSLRTVFYSTRTNQDTKGNPGVFSGSIGVSELVSGYIDDEIIEKRDYTQGTGYFSKDNFNSAIDEIYNLDPNFTKRNSQFGTDIYILGFVENDEWENDIINSILDSFMVSIVRGELAIVFNGREISKNTIKDLVYDDSIIYRGNRSNIVSQYRLLTDGDNVKIYDIETDYGACTLHILPLSKEEEDLATHKCVMVRHPLMKIKEESLGASFRVSAMCIIGNGKLGAVLRSIENPQHIDWEPKRLKNKTEKREIEKVLKDIKEQIKQRVIECLQIGDENPLDPNGAGDFLPDEEAGSADSEAKGDQKPTENVSVSKRKQNDTVEKNANQSGDDGKGIEPDIGGIDEEQDGEILHPDGHNKEQGGGNHPGNENSAEKDGENVIFKRSKLSGVRYKVISTDKTSGRLKIIFSAPIDYEKCFLSLSLIDDANYSSSVEINSMSCNGIAITSTDSKEFGPFSIKTNEKIVLDVSANAKGFFASEVKVICK